MTHILDDPIFEISHGARLGLAALFAAMARGEVAGFAGLRPHQRAAWHMFLVQLATLALWRAGRSDIAQDAAEWAALLRALTPEHRSDEPWRLVVDNWSQPAFLQPPVPEGINFDPAKAATGPDALDLLITSRNHDLKQRIMAQSAAEDWVYALVSLQTMEGYGGAGNHGIVRMNGGASSRPLLAIAPANPDGNWPHASAWWRRDVAHLLAARRDGPAPQLGKLGGPALLWCLPWHEGEQLRLDMLDPLFIEVCRRVRLKRSDAGALVALKTTSTAARCNGSQYNGSVGDPWAPVHADKNKSLTLGEGDFTYRRIVELTASGTWNLPLLATPGEEERDSDGLLVAEALSRGNSKTFGHKFRVLPLPKKVVPFFARGDGMIGEFTKTQIGMIDTVETAVRFAIALITAGGDDDKISKDSYARAAAAKAAIERRVDAMFFAHLWARLAAEQDGDSEAKLSAERAFRLDLTAIAHDELRHALPAVPCSALLRRRAEVRAWRAFHAMLRKAGIIQAGEEQRDAA
ncbi:MAG: hypothetical protein KDJ68_14785 [Rhodobiaceae bacterium]|nr:hypothetical protein [Paracoccaceae bacterium]MCB1474097.1 hypothetical protein [Rhodobiaceae bacterium]